MFRRTITYMIAVMMLLITGNITAQNNFEGSVSYKVDTKQQKNMNMTYFMQEDAVRIEMDHPAQQGMGAMLMKEGKMYILMPQQEMYMVTEPDMENMRETEPGDKDLEEELEDFEDAYTGETENILGYETKKYEIEQDGNRTEMWLATGLGNFVPFRSGMKNQETPDWAERIGLTGFFPLKVKVYDGAGNMESTMTATDINESDIDDSKFEVPAGWKKLDMGNMMKGMMDQMKK